MLMKSFNNKENDTTLNKSMQIIIQCGTNDIKYAWEEDSLVVGSEHEKHCEWDEWYRKWD